MLTIKSGIFDPMEKGAGVSCDGTLLRILAYYVSVALLPWFYLMTECAYALFDAEVIVIDLPNNCFVQKCHHLAAQCPPWAVQTPPLSLMSY
jgi:hypothetical protein